MRRVLVYIVILVCFGTNFSIAVNIRDKTKKVTEADGSVEDSSEVKELPRRKGFDESSDDNDDPEATDRSSRHEETTKDSTDLVDEFNSDLKAIRRFVAGARPVAENTRRSLIGRGPKRNGNILTYFLKAALHTVISVVEDYLPALRLIMRYIRQFVHIVME